MVKDLGKKIKKARLDSNMSQKELGDALGLSDKAISSYESGRAEPPLSTIQRLAKITHKSIAYFIEGEVEIQKTSINEILSNVERELNEVKELIKEKE